MITKLQEDINNGYYKIRANKSLIFSGIYYHTQTIILRLLMQLINFHH